MNPQVAKKGRLAHRLVRLFFLLTIRRRVQVLGLALLSGVAALTEMLAVGAILPFIAALQEPALFQKHVLGRMLLDHFDDSIGVVLTSFFCAAVMLAAVVRIVYLWAGLKISYGAGSEISNEIYRRTLYQPYVVYVSRSSTEVIDLLSHGIGAVVSDFLIPFVNLVGAICVVTCIVSLLVLIDPFIASTTFVGIGSIYVLIGWFARRRTARISQEFALSNRERLRTIQEGIGGMRDILINSTQASYLKNFRKAESRINRARTSSRVIGGVPRYVVEAAGLTTVALLASAMSSSAGLSASIPILAAFAIGAQRLLPALQSAYAAWTSINTSVVYVDKVFHYIDESGSVPLLKDDRIEPMVFRDAIRLEDVEFNYGVEGSNALQSVSLEIRHGTRVGIIGTSGSGKSTLVDVLMGLLEPTRGRFLVDDTEVTASTRNAWQANLSHVPQTVFLSEGSVEENIAFGSALDQIDPVRVREAAKLAQIDEFIETLPSGYATPVGDRGMRLSGGQRQRIGIARALYRQSQVLVFDEATSALDAETERSVMQAVEGLSKDLTIILIAHRLSTLQGCDQIISLKDGKIVRSGSYQEMIGSGQAG